jgi:hypothetical protein
MENIEVAELIIKKTTAFLLNQISIEKEKGDRLKVYSIDENADKRHSFFATELCNILLIIGIANYVSTDSEGYCCLMIY